MVRPQPQVTVMSSTGRLQPVGCPGQGVSSTLRGVSNRCSILPHFAQVRGLLASVQLVAFVGFAVRGARLVDAVAAAAAVVHEGSAELRDLPVSRHGVAP